MHTKPTTVWTALVALLVTGCVLIVVLSVQGSEGSKRTVPDARRVTAMSISHGDKCYPDLPKQLRLGLIGQTINLLARTDSLSSVVRWAEHNLKDYGVTFTATGSNDLHTECFLVLYTTGSGLENWCYLAYVPEYQAGQKNWHLLCEGFAVPYAGWEIVDYPRIDGRKGTLTFTGKDGKIIKSVNIRHPLDALRKHLRKDHA